MDGTTQNFLSAAGAHIRPAIPGSGPGAPGPRSSQYRTRPQAAAVPSTGTAKPATSPSEPAPNHGPW